MMPKKTKYISQLYSNRFQLWTNKINVLRFFLSRDIEESCKTSTKDTEDFSTATGSASTNVSGSFTKWTSVSMLSLSSANLQSIASLSLASQSSSVVSAAAEKKKY